MPVLSAVPAGAAAAAKTDQCRYPLREDHGGRFLRRLALAPDGTGDFPALLALFALLVILAFIDLDTQTLPDALDAYAVRLAATFASPGSGTTGVRPSLAR